MKTSKLLLAGLATTMILGLSITSSYAYGNGGGNGNGGGKGMHQGQGQNGKGNKSQHSPSEMLLEIEKQSVSTLEIDLLEKQYEEEMMANELYNSFYEMYQVQTFKNIADSEAKHMEAVQALLDRYEIDTPTNYNHIQSLYDELKSKGELSLKDALEVGISIEKVDIDDIIVAIKSTDNNDIKIILTNIGGASYNHMRGFVKSMTNNNLNTDIDYSDYLTDEDVNTKGPIKVKLAEKLESEGVNLPEQASSEYLNKKCSEESSNTKSKKGENNSNLKNQYKNKYGLAISKLSDEKLNILIEKIDKLSEKINEGDYLYTLKKKYIDILSVLREIAVENLNKNGGFLDKLFD